MDKNKQPFALESVDDDIDQLTTNNSSILSDPDAQLIRELRHVYKEDPDSLKHVWERLERYSMPPLAQGLQAGARQRLAGDHQIFPYKSNARYPASQLFTVLAATVTGVFLVSSLAWVLTITHLARPEAAKPISRANLASLTSRAANVIPTQPNAQSKPPTPLEAIHMLDKTHGWALADTSVLKTSDGGQRWQVVTPSNAPVLPGLQETSKSQKVVWVVGTFMSQKVAWVVGITEPQPTIIIQHTSDGGSHWQSSQLSDKLDPTTTVIDPPYFINMQEGWLDIQVSYTMGSASSENHLFHTIDGGLHWSLLATTEQMHQNAPVFYGVDTGISVKDAQNIWETIDLQMNQATGVTPNVPIAFVTHNGGKTWQEQDPPSIPGSASMRYTTTPPVFFGNYGLMPVKVTSTTSGNAGLSIYVTNDGGIHWSSYPKTAFEAEQVYILDQQHIWVESMDGSMHESLNGGKSWNTLGSIGKPFTPAAAMSFTDTNNGWVITVADAQGNSSQLLHTTNSGRTWQPINYSIQ